MPRAASRLERFAMRQGGAFHLLSGGCTTNPSAHIPGEVASSRLNRNCSAVIPWLLENRNGLTVFAHANTGDDLKDHTEHVLWLGPSETLNLAMLSK
jgi:DOPA 4,5-dioxygenase